jgi:CBS domain-containing protein
MKSVSEIMTRGVRTMRPDDSIVIAARAMKELDVGAVPVCDDDKLVGMITDRDIVLRGVAEEHADKSTTVRDIMSSGIETCFEDDDVEETLNKMERSKIRRLPVLDRDKKLVGMLSLGDVAAKDGGQTDSTLSGISSPAEPERSAGAEVPNQDIAESANAIDKNAIPVANPEEAHAVAEGKAAQSDG